MKKRNRPSLLARGGSHLRTLTTLLDTARVLLGRPTAPLEIAHRARLKRAVAAALWQHLTIPSNVLDLLIDGPPLAHARHRSPKP